MSIKSQNYDCLGPNQYLKKGVEGGVAGFQTRNYQSGLNEFKSTS